MTGTPPQASPGTVTPRLVVIALTVIACVLCVVAGAVVMTGHPTGDLLSIVGIVVGPVVVGLLAWLSATVSHVRDLANGNNSQLQASVMELARRLAAAPASAPEPAPQLAAVPATEPEGPPA